MGKPYQNELRQIPATIQWAQGQDVSELRLTLLRDLGAYNLVSIGSGGSLVAASFAAMLHELVTGRLARAATPLEAITRPSTRGTAALLLSARGTNTDIRQAAKILPSVGYDAISAISTRVRSPLGRILADYGAKVHEFSVPSGRDGFLATNSLMATMVLLHRAAIGVDVVQDSILPAFQSTVEGSQTVFCHRTLVVLAQGWAVPAAVDFETRFSEAALASVSVTDHRNFAHGRHNWLSFHADDTGIVSLETSDSRREAGRVLRYLPKGIDVLRVQSGQEGPTATIELVSTVMKLAGQVAENRGIDPGRPTVADFGRRLYRARSSRRVVSAQDAAIMKKRAALFLTPQLDQSSVRHALDDFVQRLEQVSFKALVVDYDGTLCARDKRFEPLGQSMGIELNRLLDEGMYLGVASGRGGSVHERLRESLHQRHWKRVVVGLYNGTTVVDLSEDLIDPSEEIPQLMATASSCLGPLKETLGFEMVIRPHQVSLMPAIGTEPFELRTVVIEHLAGIDGITVTASSHSVDIVPEGSSKVAVVDAFYPTSPSQVLRIGDQGSAGGNDFDLLNTGPSLSVDRVSSNLWTCWNLSTPGLAGPPLTLQYLQALRAGEQGFLFDVSHMLGDPVRPRE